MPDVIRFRITPEFEEIVDTIGLQLHREGIYGLIRNGKINRSAVIKYLIEREYVRVGGKLDKIKAIGEQED